MSRIAFALGMAAIVAAASWAYHVNYRTVETLSRVEALREEIAAEREAIQVLRVEWAHLNAPERLERLVEATRRHLTLYPATPEQFGSVAEIPYPPKQRPPLPGSASAPATEGKPPETAGAAGPGPLDTGLPAPEPRPTAWREP